MSSPLLFGLLVSLTVMTTFVALWRLVRPVDPLGARLAQMGFDSQDRGENVEGGAKGYRRGWPGLTQLLQRLGLGPKLALQLARADIPLTAAEFALVVLLAGMLGLLLGMVRINLLVGLLIGTLFASFPIIYLRHRRERRQRAFIEQLPDVLTLLVGGLRAGIGLSQALQIVIDRMPPPVATEFAHVVRAIGLGVPLQQALREMSERVDVDEVELVVTAISVQYEMGGNLAESLETIGETVRDRIRLLREVRVLTSHQRFTGYVLTGIPIGVFAVLMILRPEYMSGLFAPGWVRLLPIGAAIMMFVGFLIMRRILKIQV